MSNYPLPTHIGIAFGVSSGAMDAARQGQFASQKLATATPSLAAAHSPVVTSSSSASGAGSAPATATPTRYHAQRITSLPKASDLGQSSPQAVATYRTYLANAAQTMPVHNPILRGTSDHVASSKLLQPDFQPVGTDFNAIADSSVGGSLYMPRPYGRFMATRNGDGRAVYERRPATRTAAWHERLYHSMDDVLSGNVPGIIHRGAESSSRRGSPERGSEGGGGVLQGERSSKSRVHTQESTNPNSPRGQGQRGHSRVGAKSPLRTPTGGVGGISGGGDLDVAMRRPDSSSLGPIPGWGPTHSMTPWFTPPAATFLTDMPPVPSNLRIDCGYSAARAFLQSGLHPAPTHHHPNKQQLAPLWQQGPLMEPASAPVLPTSGGTTDATAAQGMSDALPMHSGDQQEPQEGPDEVVTAGGEAEDYSGAEGGLVAEASVSPGAWADGASITAPGTAGTNRAGSPGTQGTHTPPGGPMSARRLSGSDQQAPLSPSSVPPGYRLVHGVLMPHSSRTDAAVLGSLGFAGPSGTAGPKGGTAGPLYTGGTGAGTGVQHYTGPGVPPLAAGAGPYGVPSTATILAAIHHHTRSPAIKGQAFDLATATRPRVTHLPVERNLPRRQPAGVAVGR